MTKKSTVDLQSVLELFYKQYNPEKLPTIDSIIKTYNGNEDDLFRNLMMKYNVTTFQPFADYAEMRLSRQPNRDIKDRSDLPQSSSEYERKPSSTLSLSNVALPILPPSFVLGMQDISTNIAGQFLTGFGLNYQDGNTNNNSNSYSSISSSSSSNNSSSNRGADNNAEGNTTVTLVNVYHRDQSQEEGAKKLSSETINQSDNIDVTESDTEALRADSHAVCSESASTLPGQVESLRSDKNAIQPSELSGTKQNQFMTSVPFALAPKDSSDLRDRVTELERMREDLSTRLVEAEAHCANKQSQLLETLEINHRLEAQMRYLAIRALSAVDINDDTCGGGELAIPINARETADTSESSRLSELLAKDSDAAQLAAETSFVSSTVPLQQWDMQDLVQEIILLRRHVRVLQTSFSCSRVEMALEVRQRAVAGDRVAELQAEVDRLRRSQSSTFAELETPSDGAASAKQQVAAARAEVGVYKALIAKGDRELVDSKMRLAELSSEVVRLTEQLQVSDQARADMSAICADRLRVAVTQANDYVRAMRESVQLEREDMLARLAGSAALVTDLRVVVEEDAHREILRLTDELLKSRRREAQKERETVFLQRQLTEAARRMAQEAVDCVTKSGGERLDHSANQSSAYDV